MNIDFPFKIAMTGRTATTGYSEHVKDLIRQVIFTIPGERVNRPTFGSGLSQLVFEPNSVELVSTVQFLVKGSLQEWLSEVIEAGDIIIEAVDEKLTIQIHYKEIGSPMNHEVTFQQPI